MCHMRDAYPVFCGTHRDGKLMNYFVTDYKSKVIFKFCIWLQNIIDTLKMCKWLHVLFIYISYIYSYKLLIYVYIYIFKKTIPLQNVYLCEGRMRKMYYIS